MEKISKYKILRRIGKGGMGVVYCALDTVLERQVALKVHTIGAEPNVQAVERFFREARVIASFKHPNIVTVFDLGQEDDKVFIAMELLEGSDVTALMASGEHLTFEKRLRIAESIAQGLAHAHHRGVVHRDVKPRNVFVTHSGEVKLLDFGLAHIAFSTLTEVGQIVGTPFYMSPEQVVGGKADPRSDIFSLGALIYELMTDQKAFDGENLQIIFDEIVRCTPKPIRELVPAIPAELSRIVSKMMNKSMELRYQNADDLVGDLTRFRRFLGQYKKQLREEARRTLSQVKDLAHQNRSLFSREGIGSPSKRLTDSLERDDVSYLSLVGLKDGASLHLRRLEKIVESAALASANDSDRTLSIYDATWTGMHPLPGATHRDAIRAEEKLEAAETSFRTGDLAGSLRLVCEALRIAPDHQRAEQLAERVRVGIVRLADVLAPEPGPSQVEVLVAALLAIGETGEEQAMFRSESSHDHRTITGLSDVFLAGLPAEQPQKTKSDEN